MSTDWSFAPAEYREDSPLYLTEPGDYDFTIKAADIQLTKAGDPMVVITLQAREGRAKDRILVAHSNEMAQKIGRQKLASLFARAGWDGGNIGPHCLGWLVGRRVGARLVEDGEYLRVQFYREPTDSFGGKRIPPPPKRDASPPRKGAARKAPPWAKAKASVDDDDDIPF